MAVNEKTIGPFFFAIAKSNVEVVPVHTFEVVEMEEPWRTGRAFGFPVWFYRAAVVGVWTQTMDDLTDDDFFYDRWFSPKWLPTSVEEIADWSDDEEETQSDL